MVEWSNQYVLILLTSSLGDRDILLVANRGLSMYADAMQTFAQAEDKWYKTWPESEEDRAMRMYVVSTLYYLLFC